MKITTACVLFTSFVTSMISCTVADKGDSNEVLRDASTARNQETFGNPSIEENYPYHFQRNGDDTFSTSINNDEYSRSVKPEQNDDDHDAKALIRSLSIVYKVYCGCTYEITKELASAQINIISKLSPLFYSDNGLEESRNIILDAIQTTTEDGVQCLKDDFDCGCGPEDMDFDTLKFDSYKDCCCQANAVTDIYVDRMSGIAEIPDSILALGPEAVQEVIDDIVNGSNALLSLIKFAGIEPTMSPIIFPTKMPTISPSNAPVETIPPTPPPPVDCLANVTLDCFTTSGMLSCASIVPPAVPDDESCMETVCYSIEIQNIGTVPMNITVVDFTFNGNTTDLLGSLALNPLEPGQSTTLEPKLEVDICRSAEYCAEVTVEANPPEGDVCQDNDEYKFTVFVAPSASPSVSPTQKVCEVEVVSACTSDDDGAPCDEIPPITTQCEERPFEMVFRYNGGDCSQSNNIQSDLFFTCDDFQGGPPTQLGEQSYIRVTNLSGGNIVYFEGIAVVGEDITLSNAGERVEADMNVMIYNSSGFAPTSILLQNLTYQTCSNLFLKDRFGSLQLVAFVNRDQGVVSCFVNTIYSYNVSNVGEDTVVLQSLEAVTNTRGTVNFDVVNETIGQGGELIVSEQVVLDMTVRRSYTTLTTVVATFAGSNCSDTDFLEFVAGNPTAAPTILPTTSPTSSR